MEIQPIQQILSAHYLLTAPVFQKKDKEDNQSHPSFDYILDLNLEPKPVTYTTYVLQGQKVILK